MSPPVKTDSRLVHSICTCTHSSSVSATSDKCARVWLTADRNGTTCRMDSIACNASWDSSRSSITVEWPDSTRLLRDPHVANSNSHECHLCRMSASFASMDACFSAASHTSSTASRCASKSAASTSPSVYASGSRDHDRPVASMTCSQCRDLT